MRECDARGPIGRENRSVTSIQTLSDPDRRVIARWAAACAERVLALFDGDAAARALLEDALVRTRAYGEGLGTAAEEIRKRLVGVKAAGSAVTPAGAAAARSIGQAAAVAHMGAHALGAAAYAAKAVSLASPDRPEAAHAEVRWQLVALSQGEREVLRRLPPLGSDGAGPLGAGLLSRGILGETIRRIQAEVGSAADGSSGDGAMRPDRQPRPAGPERPQGRSL